MKRRPTSAAALAAQFLNDAVCFLERNPVLRKKSGIDLVQLNDVRSIRRQLLKQAKK